MNPESILGHQNMNKNITRNCPLGYLMWPLGLFIRHPLILFFCVADNAHIKIKLTFFPQLAIDHGSRVQPSGCRAM